jgi:hypothetical protein
MAGSGRWRYIAQRMTGDGPGEFLDFNVPLSGVDIDDILSGHEGFKATIRPEYARLKDPQGKPIIVEYGTAIWAEDPDGEIRGGGLVTNCDFDGPSWTIECTGITGTSIGLPYTSANYWVNVDPLYLFRHIWTWIQSQPGGNLDIEVEATSSPVRLGSVMVQKVDFDLEPDPSEDPAPAAPLDAPPNPFMDNQEWIDRGVKVMVAVGWTGSVVREALEAYIGGKYLLTKQITIKDKVIQKIGPPPVPPGPIGRPTTDYVAPPGTEQNPVVWEYEAYKLAWYKDHDLDAVIGELATSTPFDWYLTHRWDGEEIKHRIRVGYPRLGSRRKDLRFVVGENVRALPKVKRDATEYANEVLFLGAGEGSAQIMARAFRPADGRVRKVVVVSDTSVSDQRVANMRAQQELAKRIVVDNIADIVLEDHPNAPMGSVNLGDEILLEGETGWVDFEVWVRVVGRKISPDAGEAMTLTVIRSDRLS